jgi:hypothetical protein
VEEAEVERAVFRRVVGAVEADFGGDVVDGDGERGRTLGAIRVAAKQAGGERAVVGVDVVEVGAAAAAFVV